MFLFNDLLLVTKTLASKKTGGVGNRAVHQFRTRIPLSQVRVGVFSTAERPWGVQLQSRARAGKVLATFDARSQVQK